MKSLQELAKEGLTFEQIQGKMLIWKNEGSTAECIPTELHHIPGSPGTYYIGANNLSDVWPVKHFEFADYKPENKQFYFQNVKPGDKVFIIELGRCTVVGLFPDGFTVRNGLGKHGDYSISGKKACFTIDEYMKATQTAFWSKDASAEAPKQAGKDKLTRFQIGDKVAVIGTIFRGWEGVIFGITNNAEGKILYSVSLPNSPTTQMFKPEDLTKAISFEGPK